MALRAFPNCIQPTECHDRNRGGVGESLPRYQPASKGILRDAQANAPSDSEPRTIMLQPMASWLGVTSNATCVQDCAPKLVRPRSDMLMRQSKRVVTTR